MLIPPDQLYVFTVRYNPFDWTAPHDNWQQFATHMLDSGVNLVVVECAQGEALFACTAPPMSDPAHAERFTHIGVRSTDRGWFKEGLLNLGIRRTPAAKWIAWVDADIIFRRRDWPAATLAALQRHPVIQPWSHSHDIGPHGEDFGSNVSFCRQIFHGQRALQTDGQPYQHAHPGYAWAMTRRAFDELGGLFEVGAVGSGDHHMSMALIGQADKSIYPGVSHAYRDAVKLWETRALSHLGQNIGYVHGTIEHLFHGPKDLRGYLTRNALLVRFGFDPNKHVKYNADGVIQFFPGVIEWQRAIDLYFMSRREDSVP